MKKLFLLLFMSFAAHAAYDPNAIDQLTGDVTAVGNTTGISAATVVHGATVQSAANADFFPLFVASSTNSSQVFNLGTRLTFNPTAGLGVGVGGGPGVLNLKALGSGLGQGVNITSSGGVVTWNWIGRDDGNFFLYNGSNIHLNFDGPMGGTGNFSPNFRWDVNFDEPTTTPSTPTANALAVTNHDVSNNTYSPEVFVNSSEHISSAILGVHETQTTTPNGHLSFMTAASGTLAEALRLKTDQSVQMPHYAAGVCTFDGSGNIASVASGASANMALSNLTNPTAVNQDLTFSNAADHSLTIGTPGANVGGRAVTVKAGSAGAGTDIQGGTLKLAAGVGTGDDSTGEIDFSVPNALNSGSTLQTLFIAGVLNQGASTPGVNTSPSLCLQSSTQSDSMCFNVSDSGAGAGSSSIAMQGVSGTEFDLINSAAVSGTNAAGGLMVLFPGLSTGTGQGELDIQVPTPTGSSSSQNSYNKAVSVTATAAQSQLKVFQPGSTNGVTLTSSTVATGAGIGTLTNMPAGVSGNPTGYIQILVNGVARVVPFW